jgi:hypothetical protein
VTGAGCRRARQDPFLTYYNAEHAVTVRYPASWKTEQAQQDGAWYRYFLAPPTGADRRSAVSVTLIAAAVTEGTLEAYAQTYLAGNVISSTQDAQRPGAQGKYWRFQTADGQRKHSLLLLEESAESRTELARALAAAAAARPSPRPSPSPSAAPSPPPAASPRAVVTTAEGPKTVGGRWVYGLFSQADAAAFDAHTSVLEEMANSLTLERPRHYTEERNPKMAFVLRIPPSWKSSRAFGGDGTLLQQWTSPALAAEKGQTVHASLTLNVEPAPGDGSIDTFYTATLQKLGEAYTVLSHQPWESGYVDVMHSETQVAVSRSKRFLKVADGRAYSLVCDGRDDVYGRVSRWCDIIATTLKVGSEAGPR